MELFIQISQLLLCLSILVILHEAGHFFAAKYFKCRVEKFYLFFDPWFSLFKRKIGETEYGIGWLPLGGYVKISGMIDESLDTEQLKKDPQPWEFRSKPAWQRLIIMLAGIIVNIILAIVIYTGILYTTGEETINTQELKDGYVFSEAGKKLGFQDGDVILEVDHKPIPTLNYLPVSILFGDQVSVNRNGKIIHLDLLPEAKKYVLSSEGKSFISPRIISDVDSITPKSVASKHLKKGDIIVSINGMPIQYLDQLKKDLLTHKKDTVSLGILRGEKQVIEKIYVPDSAVLGFIPSANILKNATAYKKYSFLQALQRAPSLSWDMLLMQIKQFKIVLNPKTEAYKHVSGPLRLYQAFSPEWDWLHFWSFTAMFSIWLAFLNILPIPGLDGGHALFTIAEMITGRKLSDKAMEKVQMVGVIILLSLMVLVFGNDIWNIIQNIIKK
ncbi:RIP metalloprotease RseP [Apibacter muscae]|uniref:RIP metalloprotease RseP n=1 Tax=Apibacter muscae TaxID=2509004 RepID=UPI0011AD85E0|nr:RIP metalloprotease RseP [Apibacter muscae]TWP22513.1 RIP metalloprotease RseP [Apibacter muscae]